MTECERCGKEMAIGHYYHIFTKRHYFCTVCYKCWNKYLKLKFKMAKKFMRELKK